MRKRVMLRRGSVSVLDDGRYWEFDGVEREADDYDDAVAHLDDLGQVPAADIQAALRRYIAIEDYETPKIHVIVEGNPDSDLEYLPRSGVSFTLVANQLVMDLQIYFDEVPDDETNLPVVERLSPLLDRKRFSLLKDEQDLSDDGQLWSITLRLGVPIRGRTGQSLSRDGLEVIALLEATAGNLERQNVIDLLRSGFAESLIGQPEGDWLEVKREHYSLRDEAGQIKLARAVSQFANARNGGLVVIGLATKKVAGKDLIGGVTPTPRDPNMRRRYVQTIQNRIYPPPDGLRVEVLNGADGDITLIEIPAQPEELKPFLVHGAIIDGRVNNTFVSIVERLDDEGIPNSVASIHSVLAVGRALLRRGSLPESAG
ncbi:RNA-binding domain-containing protein [Nocardia sp. NPDC050799]|uniref:RNA-binding domain-containing protein n=1 Tax=Nocardia sp. NPDC050799 TaxID=3154842 RepID=UPI0033F4FD30